MELAESNLKNALAQLRVAIHDIDLFQNNTVEQYDELDCIRENIENAILSIKGNFESWLSVITPVSITTKETDREYTEIMAVFVETVTITLSMGLQNVPVAMVWLGTIQETVGNLNKFVGYDTWLYLRLEKKKKIINF